MKRRDALKTLGALAGAGAAARLLPGCGDDAAGLVPTDEPGSITHLVVLMMENRSYDHLLGARSLLEGKPGDGLVAGMHNLDASGTAVGIWPATRDTLCVPDPPHGWTESHRQFNAGANDGFVLAHQARHPGDLSSMQYLTREHVPISWALADHYTSCDRWFASVMGPTWPNRMYWHSGQSGGLTANTLPGSGFSWLTIYDRLAEKGIDWAYYFGNIASLSVVQRLTTGNNLRPYEDFIEQAAAGTLPPVSYIDPAFFVNDDHPAQTPVFGQQLISSIYNALATSPLWPHCLFVITYDEHGGFFDHVPPPKSADDLASEGFDQLGFRVPSLVIGPYVKPGVVSTLYDHTSVLKHIETMFGLAPLTARSTAANDLSDCIDHDRLAAGDWREPAPVPAFVVDESMLGASCQRGSGREAADHDVLSWFDAHRGQMGRFDRRDRVADYLYAIGDHLERVNAGGIRRRR